MTDEGTYPRALAPGRWAIVIVVRDPATGASQRRWHSFRGTKREAQSECARLVAEHKAGVVNLAPSKTSVSGFLTRWLAHMEGRLTPRSHERYSELINKNIAPLLGSTALAKLQPAAIAQAYTKALKCGRRDGKGGLSPRTVLYMHRVLRHALAQAVRWGLLARNPADQIDPPRIERKQMKALVADSTARLLVPAREDRLFIAILLAALCGMRRGEIAALRWRSVHLDRGELSVVASTEQTRTQIREKPPKNGRGRTIALPSLLIEELRRHRIQQAENLLKLGVRLSDDHHVVMREDCLPLQPRSLTHAFQIFLHKHKLPRIRLHDLRHTHATQMLASGVHPKVAQERLGHSSVSITLDLYSHVLPGMQADAAERVDQALRAALERNSAAIG